MQKTAPVPVPAMGSAQKESETVELTFFTNVDAKVVDSLDERKYGRAAQPIKFPRSDRSIALKLEATGYYPVHVTVQPKRDQSFRFQLSRIAEPKQRPKSAQIEQTVQQINDDVREIRMKLQGRATRPKS